MDRLVATFNKNSREQVQVLLRTYKGRDLIDLRVFWTQDGKEWLPSKKGLALSVDQLPVLLAALHKAAEVIGEAGPESEVTQDELLTNAERGELAKLFELKPDEIEDTVLGQ